MFAANLCQVFSPLFTKSLKEGIARIMWKTSTFCPIPKCNSYSILSDNRPIVMTSFVMKCYDIIVVYYLYVHTNGLQGPSLFAYKPRRRIEQTILIILLNTFIHTHNPQSYEPILFADVSFAFSTIKPYHLAKKLTRQCTSPQLVIWIIYRLHNTQQFFRFIGVLSGERSISTGVPQGCDLSQDLFMLYTNE